MYALEEESPC